MATVVHPLMERDGVVFGIELVHFREPSVREFLSPGYARRNARPSAQNEDEGLAHGQQIEAAQLLDEASHRYLWRNGCNRRNQFCFPNRLIGFATRRGFFRMDSIAGFHAGWSSSAGRNKANRFDRGSRRTGRRVKIIPVSDAQHYRSRVGSFWDGRTGVARG